MYYLFYHKPIVCIFNRKSGKFILRTNYGHYMYIYICCACHQILVKDVNKLRSLISNVN